MRIETKELMSGYWVWELYAGRTIVARSCKAYYSRNRARLAAKRVLKQISVQMYNAIIYIDKEYMA